MRRLSSILGLTLALFAWPAACSRHAPQAPEPPVPDSRTAQRQQAPRCSYGRVPTADARAIEAAIRDAFRPSPDNSYEVLGVYYAEPGHGPSYAFRAVLRVVGIAGPQVPIFEQVTGAFDRRTREAAGLTRTRFDPARCPEIATASSEP